jgi:hypothetical protein
MSFWGMHVVVGTSVVMVRSVVVTMLVSEGMLLVENPDEGITELLEVEVEDGIVVGL